MNGTSPKISLEELRRRMADPNLPESELAPYFLVDETRSGAFDPALAINPDTVEKPTTPEMRARGDVVVAGANSWARLRRRWIFEARLADGYEGPMIVSEGDSWFQYPLRLMDVIDHLLPDYAIRSLDAAGDTLQNMFDQKEYLAAIEETKASVFLFSGGGNDVLGGGNLKEHLRDFDPQLAPAEHLLPSYLAILDHAMALYDRIFRSVERHSPDLRTICHGYDYPIPNKGKWLGQPMEERGIVDRAFQKRITDSMVDRFNARLKVLADGFDRVTYIDLRGKVGADPFRWDDELHPTSAAFGEVAKLFKAEIASAPRRTAREIEQAKRTTRSVGAIRRAREEEQTLTTGSRNLPAAPTVARVRRQGLSLHVGLNTIDPAHYGTDGKLSACEFDAEDMEGIALAAGFEVMGRLSGNQGSRQQVMGAIAEAATRLNPGDIFLYTYAGHGSQAPDFNKDEDDDLDETFCLYDAMLIDDEIYALWREFKDEVRVVVVSDSCHSGSVIRAPSFGPAFIEPELPPARLMPPNVAGHAIRSNRALYRDIFESTRSLNEGALVKELSFPLRCSVLLLSGCQDNQVSRDGVTNGRFTQELLQVWREGQFEGNYASFHKSILLGMPSNQSPNLMTVGRPNPAFLGQKPFSI